MVPGDRFELMARYNRWMNARLYEVCAAIPEADRRRDLGAFFGSVHATLDHILLADLAWLGRFTGESTDLPPLGELVHTDFARLHAHRLALDERILEWSRGLSEDWLAADFSFTSAVDGVTRTQPTWVLVTHMFNHQTHHRGQVTTLVKQLGHDPGVTDLHALPDLAPSGST